MVDTWQQRQTRLLRHQFHYHQNESREVVPSFFCCGGIRFLATFCLPQFEVFEVTFALEANKSYSRRSIFNKVLILCRIPCMIININLQKCRKNYSTHSTKIETFHKGFHQSMLPNLQFPAELVTFTEEIKENFIFWAMS